MTTITVRARLTEKINKDGIGSPKSVFLTGAQFLSREAAYEFAQEAVDSAYGSYEHGYIAVISIDRWNEYRDAGTDNGIDVPVVQYR